MQLQLCAAVTPSGLLSKTTQSLGGRLSLMAADRKRWLVVSIPSSAVTCAAKKCRRPMRSSAAFKLFLQAPNESEAKWNP